YLGEYHRAIDLPRRNVASLEGEHIHGSFGATGALSEGSRNCLARCLAGLGGFAEAIALGEEAVRIAKAVNILERLAAPCRSASEPSIRKGDFPKAIPLLERGLGLYRAGINPRVFPELAAALGVAYVLAGRASEALPLLEQAVEPAVLIKAFQSSSPFLWVS